MAVSVFRNVSSEPSATRPIRHGDLAGGATAGGGGVGGGGGAADDADATALWTWSLPGLKGGSPGRWLSSMHRQHEFTTHRALSMTKALGSVRPGVSLRKCTESS